MNNCNINTSNDCWSTPFGWCGCDGWLWWVNLTLAAVVLPATWRWILIVIAVACLAGLFITHVPMAET